MQTPDPTSPHPIAPAVVWIKDDGDGYVFGAVDRENARRAQWESVESGEPYAYRAVPNAAERARRVEALEAVIDLTLDNRDWFEPPGINADDTITTLRRMLAELTENADSQPSPREGK